MIRSPQIFGSFVLALLLSATAQAEVDIDETRQVEPDATVSVSNVEGSIQISGWDRSEVRITGSLSDRVEGLEISGDASRLDIEVKYPETNWGRHRSAPSELILSVPGGAHVIANGVSADITIENVNGRVRAESVSGEVTVSGSPEDLNVGSVSGDVVLKVSTNNIKYSSVSGDLDLSGLAGNFTGNAVSGSMNVTADLVSRFEAETVSGDIDLSGPLAKGARLEINTLSGDVLLRMPDNLSAKVRFETFSGDIYGDYAMPELENKNLRFTIGDGDADFSLHTFSGSVELKRSR